MMNQYLEIFWRFLVLGTISFGGPAAHIGYFQQAFVQKHKWLDQQAYGRIVALSQFLPGPSSSQVGFSIGLERAGILGGIAAFLGFTFPSFLLMCLLAILGTQFSETLTFRGIVYGLKLLAVVIVADAVLIMVKSFCQKKLYQWVALSSSIFLLLMASIQGQIIVILVAACIGSCFSYFHGTSPKNTYPDSSPLKGVHVIATASFLILLLLLPFFSHDHQLLAIFNNFYQAGSLVFGGGHVVLPLLQQSVGPLLSHDQFLTGYAAAQAVPGPMFSFASYLGAQLFTEQRFLGAVIATLAIFLPGFLLIIAFGKSWRRLSSQPIVAGAIACINAAVIGILVAALYQPISVSAIHSVTDVFIILVGFSLFKYFKLPVVSLVVSFAAMGVIINL